MKRKYPVKILVLLFYILTVSCGPLPVPTIAPETSTNTIAPTFTPSPTSSLTFTPTIDRLYLEATAIALETQEAKRRSTLVMQLTQIANATATQQYIEVLQTAQAELEATRIYEQAQQQIATEQAEKAEATARAIISAQQTATVISDQQSKEKITDLASRTSEFPIVLSDSFDNNINGWDPKKTKEYDTSIEDGVFQIIYLDTKEHQPFFWTCDNCGSFENFSLQIDIKTPKGAKGVFAGVFFGSPSRLDREPFKETYDLSLYSTGAVVLMRTSLTKMDTVKLWDKRQDLLTPDGQFHTLQIIVHNQYAIVYVDGKAIDDAFPLEYSTSGYIGIVVRSENVNILYDNLKVIELP